MAQVLTLGSGDFFNAIHHQRRAHAMQYDNMHTNCIATAETTALITAGCFDDARTTELTASDRTAPDQGSSPPSASPNQTSLVHTNYLFQGRSYHHEDGLGIGSFK